MPIAMQYLTVFFMASCTDRKFSKQNKCHELRMISDPGGPVWIPVST